MVIINAQMNSSGDKCYTLNMIYEVVIDINLEILLAHTAFHIPRSEVYKPHNVLEIVPLLT